VAFQNQFHVDSYLILNPAYRQYFGKDKERFTVYTLILRLTYKILTTDERRELARREGKARAKDRVPEKPKATLEQWALAFNGAVDTLGKKATDVSIAIDDRPNPTPDSNVFSIKDRGKVLLHKYKDEERRLTTRMIFQAEKVMDSLWEKNKKTLQKRWGLEN